ncbi:MAG TPA: hypothetical protein VN845_14620, partial [Solirubrobacteraceae bacterium]|nr:hypothetical protein [Solirubrobacteraceae bacterium]
MAHAATTVVGWGRGEALGLDTALSVNPTALPIAEEATAAAVGSYQSESGNEFVLTPSGVRSSSSGFALISGTAGAKAVATGDVGTLILQGDGTVLGFGESQSTPTPIAGLSDVTAIAVGGSFSLVLVGNGSVWSWASGATPAQVVFPPGSPKATAIAAGDRQGLALMEDGSVWAWGENSSGQVGNGEEGEPIETPVQVIAPPAPGAPHVTAISAGDSSSYALYSDGSFKAWGGNGYGQLGLGNGAVNEDTPTAPSPTLTAALPDNYPPLTQISAVGSATYAIAAGGDLLAWGDNEDGQLGFGASTSIYDFPFPYPSGSPEPGAYSEAATEIPQRVGHLQYVSWLGVGATGLAQIADGIPPLRPKHLGRLPFYSHVLGTISAPEEIQVESIGESSTTVSHIQIVGPDAGDFEIVGQNTGGVGVGVSDQLPITVGNTLFVYVRFIPSALGERSATLQIE